MKQRSVLTVLFFLLTSLAQAEESMPPLPPCERQKNTVAGSGLMARIPFNEEMVIIFRGKTCIVTNPFEVFITLSEKRWLLVTARDGSTVSWKNGQESIYTGENSTVRPLQQAPAAISVIEATIE